ncbi:MAG: secretin N-terminal domain-containing protein [Opitutaceae bacterium]|jgi:type IV pilus assembly protein PilQ
MRTRTLLLAMLAATAPLSAQQEPTPAPSPSTPAVAPSDAVKPAPTPAPAPAPDAVTVVGANPTASSVSKSKDTLSVDFPDEEIRTILRNVADLFELNLVIPDTLQGRTSLKLRDVTWRQIFQVVLSPVGYTFAEDGNIIKVVSQDSLAIEPVSTEVFIINYAKADDIVKTISTLVDPATGGKIIVDTRSNALVVTERPSRMSRIRPIIEKLDKATAQVMIESKFIDVTDGDTKKLGVDWSTLSAYGASAGPFTQDYSRTYGSSSANGTTATNTNVPFLQSQYAQMSSLAGFPVGPALNHSTYTDAGGVVHDVTTLSDASAGSTSTTSITDAVVRTSTAVFSADQFKLVLSAIKTQSNAKVVSNPTLVTLNNVEASINIGEEFPLPEYTYNQQTGSFAVSGFSYKPLGVLLKVTPQVNSAGFIKLLLQPEISSRGQDNLFNGANIPSIITKKTQTQVSLKDGYTMGIGGLMENSIHKAETKVPILGDIPLLGRLFRSNTGDNTTHNLLIFITARTVSENGAPINEVFDPRVTRSIGLRKDELPGYRDGSDPFAPQPSPSGKKKKSK